MSGYSRSIGLGTWGFGLMACAGAGDSATPSEAEIASIRLELTSVTQWGNTYRLGPATFDISESSDPVMLTVEATGDEPALHVPVPPGAYEVSLRPGWVLSRVEPTSAATPVTATLLSPPIQMVFVSEFQSVPLVYSFHLGEPAIDIGIDVDEGPVPPGYDALISPFSDGLYQITFADGVNVCCYNSASEAQATNPDLSYFVIEP
jgi:hypothetical protein